MANNLEVNEVREQPELVSEGDVGEMDSKRLAQLRQNGDVRQSYISPLRPEDHARREALLARAYPAFEYNKQVYATERSGKTVVEERVRLDWPEKEQDFEHWKLLLKLIATNVYKDDRAFFKKISRRLTKYVSKKKNSNSFFSRLDSKSIKVTAAHGETTPFAHTLNVLKKLNTQDYESSSSSSDLEPGIGKTVAYHDLLAIFRLRVAALFHDLGKWCGANGDYYQDHAYFSSILFADFSDVLLSDSDSTKHLRAQLNCSREDLQHILHEIALIIRFHHISELGDYFTDADSTQAVLTPSDVVSITNGVIDDDVMKALIALSEADIASVKSYEHYRISSQIVAIKAGFLMLENILRQVSFSGSDEEIEALQAVVAYISSSLGSITKLPKKLQEDGANLQKLSSEVVKAENAVGNYLYYLNQVVEECPSCIQPILSKLARTFGKRATKLEKLRSNLQ